MPSCFSPYLYYEGIKYKEMIVMKQELVSDKAVENYVNRWGL